MRRIFTLAFAFGRRRNSRSVNPLLIHAVFPYNETMPFLQTLQAANPNPEEARSDVPNEGA